MAPEMEQDRERDFTVTTASSSGPVFTLVVTPLERGSTPAPHPYIFDRDSRYNDRLAPGPAPRRRRSGRTRVVLQPRRCSQFRGHACLQICFVVVVVAAVTFALGMVVYCDLRDLMCGLEVKYHMQE
jgi:hypothetical protein